MGMLATKRYCHPLQIVQGGTGRGRDKKTRKETREEARNGKEAVCGAVHL